MSVIISLFCPKHFRTRLQRTEMNDEHLLEILRQKDSQIVGLESMGREKQRTSDLANQELNKLKDELDVYKNLIEVNVDFIYTHPDVIHFE